MSIAQNLADIQKRIAAAARRAGRDPGGIRLVAVSKTVPVERLKEAVAAGQRLFGENYLQEARPKIAALGEEITWHFVGGLQTKKAKAAAGLFALIHSVDRLKLAQALNQAAAQAGRVQDILLQVNLVGEASKSGAAPEDAADLLKEIGRLDHLRVLGLMTMPPWFADPERVRPYFRALRELRDYLRSLHLTDSDLPELSMGMSGDFEAAIEEGATLVRVGSAIFGERPR
ncbi:MAG: YggS family pyridoxal phosphate-dependent enzyme [Deltaproteobacteria bacterium]|nr:YggS family pyridoxal phosphate-dependent enzyme [Deltaproteobacteria bacterium]